MSLQKKIHSCDSYAAKKTGVPACGNLANTFEFILKSIDMLKRRLLNFFRRLKLMNNSCMRDEDVLGYHAGTHAR